MRTDYIEVEVDGRRFRLYMDRAGSGLLHIYERHGMRATDAIGLFFDGQPRWNAERARFENRLGQRVLYWAWLHGQEGGTIIVLSCFELSEDME